MGITDCEYHWLGIYIDYGNSIMKNILINLAWVFCFWLIVYGLVSLLNWINVNNYWAELGFVVANIVLFVMIKAIREAD
jgi:hypothetical protein